MRNQTLKVLSTLTNHTVRHLLMGGQACVFYGAAQFSRDVDIAIPPSAENLDRLEEALAELKAEVIAVPPLDAQYLAQGLAVHFRCRHPDCEGFRIDVMSTMRGVDAFEELWNRRTTLELVEGEQIELLGVSDLVQAKKTQRDKDWPMISALVETHYEHFQNEATPECVEFWLREGRMPESLIRLTSEYQDIATRVAPERLLLQLASAGEIEMLRKALMHEQLEQQELDRQYWKPLMAELEKLRHKRRRKE